MCGFTGIIDWQKNDDLEPNLQLAINTIKHRGPDSQDFFYDKTKGIYFGFNRLKIIDLLNRSNQPFFDEEKNIIIMFNGEIYNFLELKKELSDNYNFVTSSDTEVLMFTYKKWGLNFLKKIQGMFSIAIYDKLQEKIMLVRDPIGIKPLFYALNNNQIIFSSEIKSILNTKLIKKELNPTAIDSYLMFLCAIDNLTPFNNIFKLRPGELMTISLKDKNFKNEYYWDLKVEPINENEDEIIQNTFKKIDKSIKEQMQSDVDFGCFLSGGLDSSINAILMSKHMGKPIKALTVYFDDDKNNEISFSRSVADILKAQRFEKQITQEDFWEFLKCFGEINDNLNGDLSCFPLYFLSKMTYKNNIKMVLVGEGADELFCGYNSFKYFKFIKLINFLWTKTERWPKWLKTMASAIIPKNKQIQEILRRWTNNLPWYFGANNIFLNNDRQNLFNREFYAKIDKTFIDKTISQHYNSKMTTLQKITYLETKLRLPELLLNRVDLITMNFSIESRVPFLNTDLVKYIFNIKDELKLKNNETKYLLKKSMKNIVPSEIIYRKKQGFWAPFLSWYTNDVIFANKIKNIILQSKIFNDKILNQDAVKAILNQNNFTEKTILKIWSLLILSNFYDYYLS